MHTPCLAPILLLIFSLIFSSATLASGPWHAARQNTSGWQYMTPDERVEHQRTMRSFKDYESCRTYQNAHHAQMADRALRAGVALKPHAGSGCEQLRKKGKLK